MTKILLGIIAALTISLALLGWYTKNLHADYITMKNNNVTLEAAKADLEEKVKKANEISNEYQKQLSAVDRQLAAIRMRDGKTSNCVVLDTGKLGPDGAGAGAIVPGRNGRGGLSIDWLYDFAGRCEKTRQKTIGLQKFIRKVND
jgi:hypothetical protein